MSPAAGGSPSGAEEPGGTGLPASPVRLVFLAKAVNAGLGFVVAVLIARALGPSGRAEYFLASSLGIGAFTVFHLSLDVAMFWAVAERRAPLKRLLRPVSVILVGASLLAVGACVAVGVGLGVLDEVPTMTAVWAFALVPAMMARFVIDGALWAVGRTGVASLALLVTAVTQLVAIVVWAARGDLDSASVLAISTATTTVGCLPGLVAILRSPVAARSEASPRPSRLARVGAENHLGVISLWAALRLDVFIVSALVSKDSFGRYTLAVTLAELILLATDAVALSALGRQGALRQEDSTRYSIEVASQAARLAAIQVVILAALGWPLIRVAFGSEWTEAFPVLLALAPGMIALAYIRPVAAVFVRTGRTLERSAVLFAAAAVNVAGTLLLVPHAGIVGAGIAATAAYTLAGLLTAWRMKVRYGCAPWARARLRRAAGPEASPAETSMLGG